MLSLAALDVLCRLAVVPVCPAPPAPPPNSSWPTNCNGALDGTCCVAICTPGWTGSPYRTCSSGSWSDVVGNCSVPAGGYKGAHSDGGTTSRLEMHCDRRWFVLVHHWTEHRPNGWPCRADLWRSRQTSRYQGPPCILTAHTSAKAQ